MVTRTYRAPNIRTNNMSNTYYISMSDTYYASMSKTHHINSEHIFSMMLAGNPQRAYETRFVREQRVIKHLFDNQDVFKRVYIGSRTNSTGVQISEQLYYELVEALPAHFFIQPQYR